MTASAAAPMRGPSPAPCACHEGPAKGSDRYGPNRFRHDHDHGHRIRQGATMVGRLPSMERRPLAREHLLPMVRQGRQRPRFLPARLAARDQLSQDGAGRGLIAMDCVGCGSAAVTERPDLTAQGYRRFRCRDCGKRFNSAVTVSSIAPRCRATSSRSWCSAGCATG